MNRACICGGEIPHGHKEGCVIYGFNEVMNMRRAIKVIPKTTEEKLSLLYASAYKQQVAGVQRRCGSKEDAEDIVQEAYTRAFQYAGAYKEGKGKLGAWVNTIISNCLYDHMNAQQGSE